MTRVSLQTFLTSGKIIHTCCSTSTANDWRKKLWFTAVHRPASQFRGPYTNARSVLFFSTHKLIKSYFYSSGLNILTILEMLICDWIWWVCWWKKKGVENSYSFKMQMPIIFSIFYFLTFKYKISLFCVVSNPLSHWVWWVCFLHWQSI